ncbi:MAG: YfiR family protein [Bacteroidales bacterium]|nr:YfiR family protein [Bacteroidales bacterium]MBN2821180.1 YfiR family protein [Bacteroidales bacterium]
MKIARTIFSLTFLLYIYGVSFGQSIDEYTLKAIWLGKFPYFIEWPETQSKNPEAFIIGIYGEDPFNGKLDSIYINQFFEEKPTRVVHYSNTKNIDEASILFIAKTDCSNFKEILDISFRNGVLLISDSEDSAERGVHICFYTKENHLRFKINESSMKKSDFFVSFRLLNIAQIIEPINRE